MLAKKTYKNQVTLPKEIVRGLESVEYFDVERDGPRIILQPVVFSSLEGNLETIRRKIERLGITEEDIGQAIRWARKKGR